MRMSVINSTASAKYRSTITCHRSYPNVVIPSLLLDVAVFVEMNEDLMVLKHGVFDGIIVINFPAKVIRE